MIATNKAEFESAYWASQKPEVAALHSMERGPAREQRAIELAIKGFAIDVPIMVWDQDAYYQMLIRVQYGFTWVPAMLQPNISAAPGNDDPGIVNRYDPKHPPAGSIKVSLDLDDYPPFVRPPVVVAPTFNPVGPPKGYANMYEWLGGNEPDGFEYTDARGTFKKHVVDMPPTPFGRQFFAWFVKVA